jgi:hypothetical protein
MSLEQEVDEPEVPVNIPEVDLVTASFLSTYKDSVFYTPFSKEVDDFLEAEKNHKPAPLTTKKNPLRIPTAVKFLLRYILPFYALWSRYSQGMLLPHKENPEANHAVELRFKLVKDETWVRKKYRKANRYVRRMISDSERRILRYDFPTNFRKYKPRKR